MGAGISSLVTKSLDLREQGIDYRLLQQHFQVVGDFNLGRLTQLHLCNNKLSSLPPEISVCRSLQGIYCRNNWLKWLPEDITMLTQLQLARFGGNALIEILPLIPTPHARKSLKPTRLANLESSEIQTESTCALSNLSTLRVGHNRLRQLPDGMHAMTLTTMIANNNHLTALPRDLFLMSTLQALVLSNNFICILPDSIAMAENLQVLVLTNNRLENLPASIGSSSALSQLVELYLGKNLLRELPPNMNLIPRVSQVYLSNNDLSLQEIKVSRLLHSKSITYLELTPGNFDLDEITNVTDPGRLREILTPRRGGGGGSNSNSQRSGRSGRRSGRSSGRSSHVTDASGRRRQSQSRSPGRSEGNASPASAVARSASTSPGRSRGRGRERPDLHDQARDNSMSKGQASPASGVGEGGSVEGSGPSPGGARSSSRSPGRRPRPDADRRPPLAAGQAVGPARPPAPARLRRVPPDDAGAASS